MKKFFTSILCALLIISAAVSQESVFRWAAHGSSPGVLFGEGVSADTEGNAYVTGYFSNTYALMGDTTEVVSERNSLYLSKVSPDEELLWTVTALADGIQGVTGFKTIYKNGYIYLMGDLRGNAVFGSMDFSELQVSGNEYRTMYIAKYTSNGIIEWVRTITTDNSIGLAMVGGTHDIKVDDAGAVYFSTTFRNSLNIAGTEVPDPTPFENNSNAVVAKLDANGAYQWHWNSVNGGTDYGQALALKENSLFFTARYTDSLTVADQVSIVPGFALIEFNLQGDYQWHRFMNTESDIVTGVRCFGIEFDNEDNIYLAGSYRTDIIWDQITGLESVNSTRNDAFVIKIDGATRDWIWGKALGDPAENDDIKSFAFNENGNFLFSGNYKGTMVLNDDLIFSSLEGSTDGFWAVMNNNGDILDGEGFGGSGNEFFNQMAVTPDNEAYMIGRFQNDFQYLPGDTLFNSWGSFDFFLVKLGEISSNAALETLMVNDSPLSGFQPDLFSYEVDLPSSATEVPVVSATPQNAYATLEITQASSLTGNEEERTAYVAVTSEDESQTHQYTVTFRLQSDDASLASIEVDGNLIEGFSAQIFAYELAYPQSTTDVPLVTATANDPDATLEISQAVSFTGNEAERTATIVVTAEDPEVTSTYTVIFRYQGTDATLEAIFLDDEPLENFDPETESYTIILPSTEILPVIVAIPSDENATVVIADPEEGTGAQGLWLVHILVTAEDNETTKDYYLHFRELSSNSLLASISVEGEELEDFDPMTFNYTVEWVLGDGSIPVVEATPQDVLSEVVIDQATNLEGTAQERTAVINITAEDGENTSTYTILFDVITSVSNGLEPEIINIFPNPATHTIRINMKEEVRQLDIINSAGSVILKIDQPAQNIIIDVSDYPSGIYIIRVSGSKSHVLETGRFIKN